MAALAPFRPRDPDSIQAVDFIKLLFLVLVGGGFVLLCIPFNSLFMHLKQSCKWSQQGEKKKKRIKLAEKAAKA